MTTPFATLEGQRCTAVRVHVPGIGVWFAEVELEGAPTLSGRATLALGELRLTGTIDATHDGTVALTRRLRLIGGAGGWSTLLPQRSYHSDAGVRARTVAEDVAREAGETLVAFDIPESSLGIDYARTTGPAGMTLADVVGETPWWVDFEGATRVGTRVPAEAERGTYEVLEVEPAQRLVTLAVDDLRSIGIGSILSERLDAPMTVREMEIEVAGESVRIRAWCGAAETTESRIARSLRSIIRHTTSERILGGPWKYRVVRMATDRVELQAVARDAGIPDLGPVSMWPGVAGASAELVPGAEVLIDFIDGDRRQPIVRGFSPKGGAGHAPREIVFTVEGPGNPGKIRAGRSTSNLHVAIAERVSEPVDKIQRALDALAAATVSPDDAGATALQTALRTVWGPGAPATPATDVRSLVLLTERGALGSIGS